MFIFVYQNINTIINTIINKVNTSCLYINFIKKVNNKLYISNSVVLYKGLGVKNRKLTRLLT